MVHEGGLVPKSMYQPGEEFDGTRQHILLSEQSVYHSVSLGRGQVRALPFSCGVFCSVRGSDYRNLLVWSSTSYWLALSEFSMVCYFVVFRIYLMLY